MKNHNPQNERIKHDYFNYLKQARGFSEASIDASAKALSRFEAYTQLKAFGAFRPQQAVAFKARLSDEVNERTGERLSKATLHSTLTALKHFFEWLSGIPGFKSKIAFSDAAYFNLSEKDTRIARAQHEQPVPSIDQILQVLAAMPTGTDIERRDQAVIAFILLTGARDGAVASMKLKHVDLIAGKVDQDAREVKTKFSKTFATYFFPVGDEVRRIVADWIDHLRTNKQFGADGPLFPATRIAVGASQRFEATGLDRKGWRGATKIRAIFKAAFAGAGLHNYPPHSFRKTLAQLGSRLCQKPEEFKAWSQNLGHEQVMTTFSSYGQVATPRQAEIIRRLGNTEAESGTIEGLAAELMRRIKKEGGLPSA